jgi:ribosomal protein S12 methylthiotransferase
MDTSPARTVALVTLGCARNDVDSEELAARLEAGGFRLVDDAADAETVVVNTCGFVETAKKDSVDTLLAAADQKDGGGTTQAVVAVGCLAERYGAELADALPEADAVLGFDDYDDIAERLQSILSGTKHQAHIPRDRRKLLPLAPADRATTALSIPGHATHTTRTDRGHRTQVVTAPAPGGGQRTQVVTSPAPGGGHRTQVDGAVVDAPDLVRAPASGPRVVRRRLDGGPTAPLKLASGCDRRCAFCAIPSFRGAFVSRRPTDVLGEARWLADRGAKELFLVSENSTSYGKDLGDLRLLETLVGELAAVDGIERVRVSYLQPAEMRPTLITALCSTPGVVPYFDLSFQHASGPLLRRMRRFGDAERFLDQIEQIRTQAPRAGIRSNVIVGFPGETEDDVDVLSDFLDRARLDAIGVFGYSDEDGTEAATYDGKLDSDTIDDRVGRVSRLAEEITADRARNRIGETVEVLVESVDGGTAEGRAAHQGPDVDGSTTVPGDYAVGRIVTAVVTGTDGVDLVGRVQ